MSRMGQALTFDGHDLTRHCWVRIDRPVGPATRVETVQPAGRDGDVVTGVTLEPLNLTAHLLLRARSRPMWDSIRREYAALFAARGERRLTLPDEPGLWRLATATLSGMVALPFNASEVAFDIEFCCHDPVAYGAMRTVRIPSGSAPQSVTFDVGGTAPTSPVIACESAYSPSSSDRLWTVADEDGNAASVMMPSVYAPVSIDCSEAVVLVGGDVKALTPTSNWLELAPGEHTLTRTSGTATASTTVTYFERWY